MNRFFVISIFFLSYSNAHSSLLSLRVKVPVGYIRSEASVEAPLVARVKKGKKLICSGLRKNGFYELESNTQQEMWIADTEVEMLDTYEAPSTKKTQNSPALRAAKHPVEKPRVDSPPEKEEEEEAYKRWTMDLGLSAGVSNSQSYFEFNVGINYFLQKWLYLRNAPFVRNQSESDLLFGLDSSLNGVLRFPLWGSNQGRLMGGSGLRIRNHGGVAPFLETGLGISMGGVVLDFGVKAILNSVTNQAADNEMLYSLQAAGGINF